MTRDKHTGECVFFLCARDHIFFNFFHDRPIYRVIWKKLKYFFYLYPDDSGLTQRQSNELRWPIILLLAIGMLLPPQPARVCLQRKLRRPMNPDSNLRMKSAWRNVINTNTASVCRVMPDLMTVPTSRAILVRLADSRSCATRAAITTKREAT